MRRFAVVACVLVAALMWAMPARASEITFVSQTINVGDPLTIEVVLSGNDAKLLSYAFDLAFDSSVLTFINATNGGLFPDDGFLPLVGSDGGTILNVSIAGIVTGDGVLATLTFAAIAAGNPLLSIFNAALADENLLSDPNAPLITPDVNQGTITVDGTNPIPEPSTLGLVGLGILSLARRRRRRPAAH
jgi:hypothetical protein